MQEFDNLLCQNYKMRPSLSPDGLGVAFQVLIPEDSGSNPKAGSIYSFNEVFLVWACFNPSGILTQP